MMCYFFWVIVTNIYIYIYIERERERDTKVCKDIMENFTYIVKDPWIQWVLVKATYNDVIDAFYLGWNERF